MRNFEFSTFDYKKLTVTEFYENPPVYKSLKIVGSLY